MKLYILRHGKTEWNRLGKVQGCVDIPLAEEGISLAAKVGRALKEVPFDLCFTIPLLQEQDRLQSSFSGNGQSRFRLLWIRESRRLILAFWRVPGLRMKRNYPQ